MGHIGSAQKATVYEPARMFRLGRDKLQCVTSPLPHYPLSRKETHETHVPITPETHETPVLITPFSEKTETHGVFSEKGVVSTPRAARAMRPQFKNNYLAEMWSGPEKGSYLGLVDCCITEL